ncbi:Acetylornithine aminotransferase [Listeria grayi]|uniref:Acetylornithine aminotransferase n=1 Tax=Listeria grayi TaxID=1641 RepID=A0A378MC65_LISGR|nr:Acetylornithine aminotransferase [Listeria grayi]
MTEIDQPVFLEELNIKAADFKKQLTALVKGLPGSEVRGKGFLLGIELPGPADEVIAACRENGLLVLSAGPNVLRILPPLTATEEEITAALAILNDALLEKWMIQEG